MRLSGEQWSVTIPPLHIVATNFRLIIWPQTRKPYPPASIPTTYIVDACPVDIGYRRGFRISLRTGLNLNLVVNAGHGHDLLTNIQQMHRPPSRWGKLFAANLSPTEVTRMIAVIERM